MNKLISAVSFIILLANVPLIQSMESKFSLKRGFKKTFQNPWTYAIPLLSGALGGYKNWDERYSVHYGSSFIGDSYEEYHSILPFILRGVFNPFILGGTAATIIKNSFPVDRYKQFNSLIQVVLDHPYLTLANFGYIFGLYSNAHSGCSYTQSRLEGELVQTVFAIGATAFLMYDCAIKKSEV